MDFYSIGTYSALIRRLFAPNQGYKEDRRASFSEWAQIVYAQAAAAGVRRLASRDPERGDVNLVGLLELLIRDAPGLWECFLKHYPEDAARARECFAKEGGLQTGWDISACKRLLGEDRRTLISVAQKAVHFASKRVAHSVPDMQVKITFSDVDDAIETVKTIAETYIRLLFAKKLRELEPLHHAGQPTGYLHVRQLSKHVDLLEEMKRRKLPKGWDEIFLEAWASPEVIERPHGETPPPIEKASGA